MIQRCATPNATMIGNAVMTAPAIRTGTKAEHLVRGEQLAHGVSDFVIILKQ